MKKHLVLSSLLLLSMLTTSCNVTGGIDSPGGTDELLSSAKIKLDSGDCDEALNKIRDIGENNNDVKQVRGWAQICKAGAKMGNIGSSLFSYNTTSGDLTIIGTLANSMVPSSDSSIDQINLAIATFESMVPNSTNETNERLLYIAFARMVKAAALLAKSSSNAASVRRDDISPSSCLGNCLTTAANCTVSRMSDADATTFNNEVNAAFNLIGSIPSLGAAKDLANQLNTIINIASGVVGTAKAVRCGIYNSMLSN